MKYTRLLTASLCFLLLISTSPAWATKDFPPWDEGVFAEVAKRHGEKAAARLRDVYSLIIVYINDPVADQLEAVNEYMNELKWIADSELWKQEDYWATPFETVTTFGGDCEDIAIAKYTVLRLMGVPDADLGFAHVITSKGENHMVLIYKNAENVALILDNQHSQIVAADKRTDLRAVYVFQNDGTVFVIKDDGKGARSILQKRENTNLSKWLTVKERAKENSGSYMPFNEGRPLAPEWARN